MDLNTSGILCQCRGVESALPSLRARAFDVLYNLSVHAELLHPHTANSLEAELQVQLLRPPKRKKISTTLLDDQA